MKMYLAGEWVDRDQKINVLNPFNGQVFDTVPSAGIEDVVDAIASAVRGAKVMASMSGPSALRDTHAGRRPDEGASRGPRQDDHDGGRQDHLGGDR